MNLAQRLWWTWNQPRNEARRIFAELTVCTATLAGLIWTLIQIARF